jgi:ribose transport system substrate-binding protein
MKLGADAAAREFNVDIVFEAPDNEDDVGGQIKLVKEVLGEKGDKKIDAMILAASDYNNLVGVTEQAYDMSIPVVIVDSEVNTNKYSTYIATNNLDAGKKLGNMVVSRVGKNCSIAIMSFVKGTRSAEQREEGLLEEISAYPGIKVAAKEYCLSDTKLANQLTKKIIRQNPEIKAIAALNSIASMGVAQAIDEMGQSGKIKVIAFDSTPQEIDYLEKGTIDVMIIQNPFNMGYLGVKNAVDAINEKSLDRYFDTKIKIIDRNNMMLPENQRMLFPFVK